MHAWRVRPGGAATDRDLTASAQVSLTQPHAHGTRVASKRSARGLNHHCTATCYTKPCMHQAYEGFQR